MRDAVCEFEIATIDVAGNEERSPKEVTEPEDEDPKDAKEDPNKAGPDEPKSELIITNDEATEPEAVVPEPRERLPVPVLTDLEMPDALVELP